MAHWVPGIVQELKRLNHRHFVSNWRAASDAFALVSD
jgi:hypothetical protein